MTHKQLLIPSEAVGMRLDRWIRRQYPQVGQGLLEKLLRKGAIRLDGVKVQASIRLKLGQVLIIPTSLESLEVLPSKPLRTVVFTQKDRELLKEITLWEDEELLVLNKPHGLAVQGGSRTQRHLDGLLTAWGHETKQHYRLVHRLDRDTSGVYLVAKSQAMATHLTEAFRLGRVQKIYWAIVVGIPKPGQGKIVAPLSKPRGKDMEKVVVDEKEGKTAITHYRTLKKLAGKFTWLELSPETGRTHQLRAHCAYIGHPVVGDGKYGGALATQHSRELHLHSYKITFPDRQGNKLTFMAPPPQHVQDTLKRFGVEC